MIGRVVWLDYTVDEELGVLVRLSARMEDGSKRNIYVEGTEPYIFAPEDENVPNRDYIKRTESGYESLFDKPLQKVVTETPKQAGGLTDNFSWTGEADVPYYRRVSIHDDLSGYIDIPQGDNFVHIDDIDTDVEYSDVIEPRISIADIEVQVPTDGTFSEMQEKANQPINVICSYDTQSNDYTVFFFDKFNNLKKSEIRPQMEAQLEGTGIEEYGENSIDLVVSETETDLLKSFIDYVQDCGFDLISGWNFTDFDYQYIIDRINTLNNNGEDIYASWLSPFDRCGYSSNPMMQIRGLPSFDMMEAFCNKLTFSNWRSQSLEYVANEELGVGKIDDVNINKDWKNTPSRLIAYNIVDVILTVALDDTNDIHNFFYEMTDACSIPVYDGFYEKRLVDGYVMSRRGDEEVLPTADESELIDNAGGYVADPADGRLQNIGVSDLKSLYPSAMITWNISTETVAETPEEFENYVKIPKVPEPKEVDGRIHEHLIDMDWLYASLDKEGLIPRTLKKLFKKRNREKELMYEAEEGSAEESKWNRKQGSTKVIMNCFEGDTDVMTPSGIQNIKNIEVGDDVYSIDPRTNELEVQTVSETTATPNLYGEIEHISNSRVDQKITKNHKLLTEEIGLKEFKNLENNEYTIPNHKPVKKGKSPDYFDIVEWGWVNEGRIRLEYNQHGRTFKKMLPDEVSEHLEYSPNRQQYVLNDIEIYKKYCGEVRSISENVWIQHDSKHGSVPVVYESESFVELIAWFITEGHCYSDNRTASKTIEIGQKTQPGINDIKSCLEKCGLNYNDNVNGFCVGSTVFYDMFKGLCGNGSYEKEIPDFIFDLEYNLRDVFWNTLVEGDGSRSGNFVRYSTASDKLKEDVCKLLVLQGWQPQVRRDSGVWRIQKSDGSKIDISQSDTKEHNEKVYCVTLEDNHTILAGRNGKFSWIGQSFYGNASSKYWRLSNEYLGDAVTSTARYTLWKGRKTIERLGYDAVYGDTDSHFIQLTRDTVQGQIDELEQISEEMDSDASEIADDIGIEDKHPFLVDSNLHGDEYTCMKWEPEKIYSVWMQLGQKKRYAGNIQWKEGTLYTEPEISISGFENQRSDSPEITAELQKKVIKMILTGEDFVTVSDYIQSIIDEIDTDNSDVKKFALPGSINKPLHEYPNREVPRACMWSNSHLEKRFTEDDDPFVYYVKETPSDLPQTDVVALEWDEEVPDGFELDKEAIIERAIRKPIQSIIDEMDWKFNEIRSGKRQTEKDLSTGGSNPFT